ncbi:hypothetical protein GCM10020227_02160 [Streptomyces flavovirens]
MAQALVEEHSDVLRAVQQDRPRLGCRPRHLPYGGGEPGVPEGRALDAGRVVHSPQQPFDLGVLAGRVDPDPLPVQEGRFAPQHLTPGHGAGRRQPGGPHRVLEEGDPAVAGVADDREARSCAIR